MIKINIALLLLCLFSDSAIASTSYSKPAQIHFIRPIVVPPKFGLSELNGIYCHVLYLDKILIAWDESLILARLEDHSSSQTYISNSSSSPHHLFSILGVRLQKSRGNKISENDQIFIYLLNDKSRGTLVMGDYYYELYHCQPAFLQVLQD